jgi:type II secretory pathway pseudopilin PulG
VSIVGLALTAAGRSGMGQIVASRVRRRAEEERQESVQQERDERQTSQQTDGVKSSQKVTGPDIKITIFRINKIKIQSKSFNLRVAPVLSDCDSSVGGIVHGDVR